MRNCRKLLLVLFLATTATLLFSRFALAQDAPQQGTLQPQTSASSIPQKAATDPDDVWHFGLSPYLWFAGVHGTVGVRGYETGIHASFSEIFDYLNLGLMFAVEPRYKKFSAPVDFMWMKLSDDKALPFEIGPTSSKAKMNQTMFTPKAAYRLVDGKMLKVDGNLGIRYFHIGTTLTFVPGTIVGPFYQSANWVDVISGARIQAALSPKMIVTILGDAGAGGANLAYQVGAFLGYRVKPKIALQAGWRYLAVNYRPKSTFVYDTETSGLLFGATLHLK